MVAKALRGLVGSCPPSRMEKRLPTGRDAAVRGFGMPGAVMAQMFHAG